MRWIVGCAVGVLVFLASVGSGAVKIEPQPPDVERKTFDPARPPKDMPPLKGNEAALTSCLFDCSIGASYHIVDRKREGGRCISTIKVQDVTIKLQLKIVIWLPEGASAKLKAHEEGHRQIDERVYEGAEGVARTIAEGFAAKVLTSEGPDCAAAETAATEAAQNKFCQSYLDQTARSASEVGDAYDRLTAHGTKAEPAEDEAIRQAFAMQKK